MSKIRKFYYVMLVLFGTLLACMGCQSVKASGAVVVSPTTVTTEVVAPTATAAPVATTVFSQTAIFKPPSVETFICPYLRGKTESFSFFSEAIGEEIRYLVHLPPCYFHYKDRAFPTLYLLHGWPLDEYHWDALGVDEVADDWVSRQLAGPFIIVLPGADSNGRYVHSSGGDYSFEGMLVGELVPLIDKSYRTWREPQGRAIGGISRGGVWSLEIALRHADVFGAAGGHSPALALNRPLPQYDPFLIVAEEMPDVRIYLDAGDSDWARTSTARFYELLVEKDAEAVYKIHEGAHVDELWQGAVPDYVAFYTRLWPTTFETLPKFVDLEESLLDVSP